MTCRAWVCAAVILVVPGVRAYGCLNDRETVVLENQFRSSYGVAVRAGSGEVDGGSELRQRSEWNGGGLVVSAVGLVMIIAGTKIARRRLAITGKVA